MSEQERHLEGCRFTDLYKSFDDLVRLASERDIDFEIVEIPDVGVRQLWLDEREVSEISSLNAAICAFRQSDGSERVKTLSGFIPILGSLLGHEAVL
jgi:hypothetical protein